MEDVQPLAEGLRRQPPRRCSAFLLDRAVRHTRSPGPGSPRPRSSISGRATAQAHATRSTRATGSTRRKHKSSVSRRRPAGSRAEVGTVDRGAAEALTAADEEPIAEPAEHDSMVRRGQMASIRVDGGAILSSDWCQGNPEGCRPLASARAYNYLVALTVEGSIQPLLPAHPLHILQYLVTARITRAATGLWILADCSARNVCGFDSHRCKDELPGNEARICDSESTYLAQRFLTMHGLTGGRFSAGVGAGSTEQDYAASGVDFTRRFRMLKENLELIRRLCRGEQVGEADLHPWPATLGGPRILIGSWYSGPWGKACRN